jgi:hypothetical protein
MTVQMNMKRNLGDPEREFVPAGHLESAKYVSEKILQRYVFEKLSESAATARTLLPKIDHSQSSTRNLEQLVPFRQS